MFWSKLTEQEFIEKYGKTCEDGTPRFGDDYTFLHGPSELSLKDTLRLDGVGGLIEQTNYHVEKFYENLVDGILP